MIQHNITPYDEMMAFLINATCPILSYEHEWLCGMHDDHENFETILHDEMRYIIGLAIKYGFFDSLPVEIMHPEELSLSDLLSRISSRGINCGGVK